MRDCVWHIPYRFYLPKTRRRPASAPARNLRLFTCIVCVVGLMPFVLCAASVTEIADVYNVDMDT